MIFALAALLAAEATAAAPVAPPASATELSEQAVFICRLSDPLAGDDAAKAAPKVPRHDVALLLQALPKADSRGAYAVELADPEKVVTQGPLTVWKSANLDSPEGAQFVFQSAAWPASGQAIGIRAQAPRRFATIGGKKRELFDSALLERDEALREGFCFVGDKAELGEFFDQLKRKAGLAK